MKYEREVCQGRLICVRFLLLSGRIDHQPVYLGRLCSGELFVTMICGLSTLQLEVVLGFPCKLKVDSLPLILDLSLKEHPFLRELVGEGLSTHLKSFSIRKSTDYILCKSRLPTLVPNVAAVVRFLSALSKSTLNSSKLSCPSPSESSLKENEFLFN